MSHSNIKGETRSNNTSDSKSERAKYLLQFYGNKAIPHEITKFEQNLHIQSKIEKQIDKFIYHTEKFETKKVNDEKSIHELILFEE